MRLDRSLLEVMLARDRAGIAICIAEVRHGRLPDVRQLARRMLVDQQREVHQLRAWRRAWSTATSRHPNIPRARTPIAAAALSTWPPTLAQAGKRVA